VVSSVVFAYGRDLVRGGVGGWWVVRRIVIAVVVVVAVVGVGVGIGVEEVLRPSRTAWWFQWFRWRWRDGHSLVRESE